MSRIQPVQGPQGDSGGLGGLGGLAGAIIGGAAGAFAGGPSGAMAGSSLGMGLGQMGAQVVDPGTMGGNTSSSIPAIETGPIRSMADHPEILNARIADAKNAMKEVNMPLHQYDAIHSQLNEASNKLNQRLRG